MEPTSNRFYCYGNVYISMGQDQAKTNQAPMYYAQEPGYGRGHCEICDFTFSTPTTGLSGGQEWTICAECRVGLDLAKGKSPYKTRMCFWFKSKEGCPSGNACTFMHGINDKGSSNGTQEVQTKTNGMASSNPTAMDANIPADSKEAGEPQQDALLSPQ